MLDKVAEGVVLVALAPHEFIEVGAEQVPSGSITLLVRLLALLPHALDVVSAGSGLWVNEVLFVVVPDVVVA